MCETPNFGLTKIAMDPGFLLWLWFLAFTLEKLVFVLKKKVKAELERVIFFFNPDFLGVQIWGKFITRIFKLQPTA